MINIISTIQAIPLELPELKLGYVGIIMAAIAVVSAMYSAYTTSQSQKQQAMNADANAEHERMMAEQTAKEKEAQAKQVEMNREAAKDAEQDQNKRRRAAIEASYAKSGVMMDGTPAEFLEEQGAVDELNVQRGDDQARQKALGLRYAGKLGQNEGAFNASMFESQADAHRTAGKQALVGGALSAVGAAAGGFGGGSAGSSSPSYSWES